MKQFNSFLLVLMLFITLNHTTFAQVKTKTFPEQVPSKFLKIKNEANILKLNAPEGFSQKKKMLNLKR